MFWKHTRKFAFLGILLMAVTGLSPTLAGTLFTWIGAGSTADWTLGGNWTSLDPNRVYPSDTATGDHVIIDNYSPRALVYQNAASVTIWTLFIGDEHEIELANAITVQGTASLPGRVQFEGDVDLSGSAYIEAECVYVNSKTQATVIRTLDNANVYTQ